MRKLASIQKIISISPIEGADAIEVAQVGGWKVVVKKGDYQPGDLAIYCEIDSWIPNKLAPFLTKGDAPREYNGVKGERLRTIKLRGQISQGLLLPIDTIGPVAVFVGFDVAELLGIQKWEAPIPAQLVGEIRGMFPSEVPKTDQERVQNLTEELGQWQDLEWEVTEKLDGTSCTMYLDMDGAFHVCSRNLDLKPSETNTYWKMAEKYQVEQKLRDNGYLGMAIQGEIVGEGIQGNPYKITGQEFYVFDIYSLYLGRYLRAEGRNITCELLGLKHVPTVYLGVVDEMTVAELLYLAEDISKLNSTTEREGIVLKCLSDSSISFKVISNKFLMKVG